MDPIEGLDAGREALRRFLAGDDDVALMRQKVTRIVIDTIPGCDLASITMDVGGKPVTSTATDEAALGLDRIQYRIGDGPCLTAMRHRGLEATSVGTEQRWPEFVQAAVEAGVTAMVSTALVDHERSLGALNLYSRSSNAFTEEAISLAALFADQLGVAAVRASVLTERADLAFHLQRALESRATIEQAKGILVANERCTPDEAFEILRRASQRENRKLRSVAEDLVRRYAASAPPRATTASAGAQSASSSL